MEVFFSYPGQSEAVRIGMGRTVWTYRPGDKFPAQDSLSWQDKRPQGAELPPPEFLRRFPPAPGGAVEREARHLGLL